MTAPNKWTAEQISLLGTKSDKDLAAEWGVNVQAVFKIRNKLGIRPFLLRANWTKEDQKLVGTMPDNVLAEKLGISKECITAYRQKQGIPRYTTWRPETIALLGNYPDEEIAKKLGVKPHTVRVKRSRLGIPMYEKTEKKSYTNEFNYLLPYVPNHIIASELSTPVEVIRKQRAELKLETKVSSKKALSTFKAADIEILLNHSARCLSLPTGLIRETIRYYQDAAAAKSPGGKAKALSDIRYQVTRKAFTSIFGSKGGIPFSKLLVEFSDHKEEFVEAINLLQLRGFVAVASDQRHGHLLKASALIGDFDKVFYPFFYGKGGNSCNYKLRKELIAPDCRCNHWQSGDLSFSKNCILTRLAEIKPKFRHKLPRKKNTVAEKARTATSLIDEALTKVSPRAYDHIFLKKYDYAHRVIDPKKDLWDWYDQLLAVYKSEKDVMAITLLNYRASCTPVDIPINPFVQLFDLGLGVATGFNRHHGKEFFGTKDKTYANYPGKANQWSVYETIKPFLPLLQRFNRSHKEDYPEVVKDYYLFMGKNGVPFVYAVLLESFMKHSFGHQYIAGILEVRNKFPRLWKQFGYHHRKQFFFRYFTNINLSHVTCTRKHERTPWLLLFYRFMDDTVAHLYPYPLT